MQQAGWVKPPAGDIPLQIVGRGACALVGSGACAFCTEGGIGSLRRTRIALKHIVRTDDRPHNVDGKRGGPLAGRSSSFGIIECAELTVRIAEKSVIGPDRISVVSGNRSLIVDAGANRK